MSEVVTLFNDAKVFHLRILVNRPEVWTFTETNAKVLVEPFRKFNSNSGWASSKAPWDRVMQAMSHYSYHVTNREFLVCDLQGGLYEDGAVLTDPVVLSRDRRFGPTDLGPEGISNFFALHVCNSYCKDSWLKPFLPLRTIAPVECATMTLHNTSQYLPLTDQRVYK